MRTSEFDRKVRCLQFAEYILENKATIRQTAKVFGFSKSTVHADLAVILPHVNSQMYSEVHALLVSNWNARYIRGGISTGKLWHERAALKQSRK